MPTTEYGVDQFFQNAGTSSKWVYNAAGVLVNVTAGTLALDYDPVTHAARGLLCEPQATNLCISSSGFESAYWIAQAGITVTPNTTASPTGTMDADTVSFSAITGISLYTTVAVFAGANSISIWAKTASGTKQFRLRLHDGAEYFSPDFTATTTWQRFSATVTPTNSVSGYFSVHNDSGDTAGSIIVWGAQCETGSIVTSHMPTAGATVTRAADIITFTPASINYSATAGSWWVDATPALTGYPIIGFANGSASPSKVASASTLVMFDGTNTQKTVANSLAAHKTSAAYAAGDRSFTADGLTVQVDTGSTTNLLNPGTIGLGNTPGVGASTGLTYIRQLRYVPRRKTSLEQVTESA